MSKVEREKHASSNKESVKSRQAWLASTFREQMTLGQSFNTSNKYRKGFYNDVIRSANEVNSLTFLVFERMTFFQVHETQATSFSEN
jgi:hypothetical protein